MRKIIGILGIILFGIFVNMRENTKVFKFENEKEVLVSRESFKLKSKENMQGITYSEGKYYIGYDIKNGNGIIETYTKEGEFLNRSNPLKIGHSAGLAFNKNDGHIYVANGGGKNKTKVYKVNTEDKMEVVKEYDFGELGNSALIAIDDKRNEMILHTSKNDKGEHIFSRVSMKGKVKERIILNNLGIPQGLEYYKGHLYFYTNNKLWVIDFKKGTIIEEYNINEKGESEGITFISDDKELYISYGYNTENRIYKTKIE